jgi:hypothetical protein
VAPKQLGDPGPSAGSPGVFSVLLGAAHEEKQRSEHAAATGLLIGRRRVTYCLYDTRSRLGLLDFLANFGCGLASRSPSQISVFVELAVIEATYRAQRSGNRETGGARPGGATADRVRRAANTGASAEYLGPVPCRVLRSPDRIVCRRDRRSSSCASPRLPSVRRASEPCQRRPQAVGDLFCEPSNGSGVSPRPMSKALTTPAGLDEERSR